MEVLNFRNKRDLRYQTIRSGLSQERFNPARSDAGFGSYYPQQQQNQEYQVLNQDNVQRSQQQVNRQYALRQQSRPQGKKKRKTFAFALPFLSLKFKKFGIEFSEYN